MCKFDKVRWSLGGSCALMALMAATNVQAQDSAAGATDSRAPAGAVAQTAPTAEPEMQQIIVTGSRIAQNGMSAPTPVTVVGDERLQARAETNVGDALNELPSFRALTTPNTQQAVGGNIGARVLDLRGLGATRTLVLVDGKRFVPSTTQGTIDVNLIPSLLVKRVEIVTGGASAAYGSDAVAGVVNFILDKNLDGFKGTVQAGISGEGDGAERSAQAAWGTSFGDGRGHFQIAGEYTKSEGLGDCYTREWCPNEQLIGNSPAGFDGLPASIRGGPAGTGTLSSGGLIVANSGPLRGLAFNPDGSTYNYDYGTIYGSNPSPLFTLGGSESGRNGFLDGILLAPPVERIVAYAHGDYQLTDSIKAGLDLSYGRVKGMVIGSDARSTLTVQRDNYYLPDSVGTIMDDNGIDSFTLGRAFTDLGGSVDYSKNETYRAVFSLEGELSDTWKWDAYYEYGRNKFRQDYSGNVVASRVAKAADAVEANGSVVCRVNADADPGNDDPGCVPINVFGSGNISQAGAAYIAPSGYQTTDLTEHAIAANINGSLFALPGGDFALAAGAEFRSDHASGSADALSTANAFWSFNGKALTGTIKVVEGYLEANAPILADVPFARTLELNGAVRQTHYTRNSPGVDSSTVDATTWKAGLVYAPADFLRFRVTRSRDIRAPNLTELFGPVSLGRTTVVDPANNGSQIQVNAYSGANGQLNPEKADTWTLGAVLTPGGALHRLRFSVDYYDINLKGAISTLGAQVLVDRCYAGVSALCDYVSRDTTGTITSVSDVLQNVSQIRNRGLDFELNYGFDVGSMGNVDMRVLATKYLKYSIAGVDRLGQTGYRPGTTTGVPDYLIDASVTWSMDRVSLNAHGRYIPEGIFDTTMIGPQDSGYDPNLPNSVNDNRVDSYFTLDLGLTFRATDRFEFFGLVNNVFNTDPSAAASAQGGTNQVYFNPYGRYFKIGARVTM